MFELNQILSSVGLSTVLIGGILWLSRNWVKERLAQSIQHEYDTKLAEQKAGLEKELETLKSELDFNKQKVENIQNGALTNLTAREGILYTKKVEAVEDIWEAKQKLDKGIICSMMVSCLNWNTIGDNEPPNPALKEFATTVFNFDIADLKSKNLDTSRLYLDPMIWAYFTAYRAIITDSVMRMSMLKSGLPLSIIKKEGVPEILKKALPEFSDLIDKSGVSCFNSLLSYISDKLLETSRDFLNGHISDAKTIERASEIIKLAETISESQVPKPPENFGDTPPLVK